MKRKPIVTPRLVLAPVAAETAAAILAGDLSQIAAGSGWPHAKTLDGLRMGSGWLVTLDGVVIGDCGTHEEPSAGGKVEIGYALAEPYRGHGYGTELVTALSNWLLAQPGVERLVAARQHAVAARARAGRLPGGAGGRGSVSAGVAGGPSVEFVGVRPQNSTLAAVRRAKPGQLGTAA